MEPGPFVHASAAPDQRYSTQDSGVACVLYILFSLFVLGPARKSVVARGCVANGTTIRGDDWKNKKLESCFAAVKAPKHQSTSSSLPPKVL